MSDAENNVVRAKREAHKQVSTARQTSQSGAAFWQRTIEVGRQQSARVQTQTQDERQGQKPRQPRP